MWCAYSKHLYAVCLCLSAVLLQISAEIFKGGANVRPNAALAYDLTECRPPLSLEAFLLRHVPVAKMRTNPTAVSERLLRFAPPVSLAHGAFHCCRTMPDEDPMRVDLGAMLAACAGAHEHTSTASHFLAMMPDLADPEDSSQPWQAADSSQQPATEASTVQLPSYIQGNPDLPAGSERPPAPAMDNVPPNDNRPLYFSPPCLQSAAQLDTAAEHDSWIQMPSDEEELNAPAAEPLEQPDEDGGDNAVEEEAEDVTNYGPAAQSARNSKHGRPQIPTLQKRRRAFVLPDDDEASIDALKVPAATHGEAPDG